MVVVVLMLELVLGAQERVEAAFGHDEDHALHQPRDDQQQDRTRRTVRGSRGRAASPANLSKNPTRLETSLGMRRGVALFVMEAPSG